MMCLGLHGFLVCAPWINGKVCVFQRPVHRWKPTSEPLGSHMERVVSFIATELVSSSASFWFCGPRLASHSFPYPSGSHLRRPNGGPVQASSS